MLNPYNANEELGARVHDLILRIQQAHILTEDELSALCFAAGVSRDWIKPRQPRPTERTAH